MWGTPEMQLQQIREQQREQRKAAERERLVRRKRSARRWWLRTGSGSAN